MTEIVDSIAGVRALIARTRVELIASGVPAPRVALVPTMGALHQGHLALTERAREVGEIVVVSIFVNPTQFSGAEDLRRYPRDLGADVATLDSLVPASGRTVIVFAPPVDEMYPHSSTQTIVSAGYLGNTLEGRSRPGHFDGVLTVVSKLLNIVQPDTVLFGQKDGQQAFLVGRMILDLDFPVSIEIVPTVREGDGLALSSRNRFLDERERRASLVLSHILDAAESAAHGGLELVNAESRAVASGEPLVQVDYFAVVDPATFLPVDDRHQGRAIAVVAALVGSTRLIDNQAILLGRHREVEL